MVVILLVIWRLDGSVEILLIRLLHVYCSVVMDNRIRRLMEEAVMNLII